MAISNLNQQRFLQPLRSSILGSYTQAINALNEVAAEIKKLADVSPKADGSQIVARYYESTENGGTNIKSIFGIYNHSEGKVSIYSYDDAKLESELNAIDEAIKDAEDAAKAAATKFQLKEGEAKLFLDSVSSATDGSITYTLNSVDVASAEALANEITRATNKEGELQTAINNAIIAAQNDNTSLKREIYGYEVGQDGNMIIPEGDVSNFKDLNEKIEQMVADTAAIEYSISSLSAEEIEALSDSANVKEAYKLVDKSGATAGQVIKIYKDSSLKSVTLENVAVEGGQDTQNLVLTYILADGGESVVRLDVSSFVSEAEFKNGLQVINGEVSVKLAEGSEAFLSVDANGVKLSGVQNAIDTAVGAAKSELLGETGTTDSVTFAGLNDRIDALEGAVGEGGSVSEQIKSAIESLDSEDAAVEGSYVSKVSQTDGKISVERVALPTVAEVKSEGQAIVSVKQDAGVVTAVAGDIAASHVTFSDDTLTSTTVEDALKEVDARVDSVSSSYLKNINVNDISGTVASNVASLTIKGANVAVADSYTEVEYPTFTDTSITFTKVAATDKLDAALSKIEGNIKNLVQAVLDNETVCAEAFSELQSSVGLDENLKYVPDTAADYISGAKSVAEALDILDGSIKSVSDKIGTTNVSQQITNAINGLDSSATSTNGTLVNITVSQADGKLSSASVDENKLNDKFADVATAITAAENAAKAAATVVAAGTTNPNMLTVTSTEDNTTKAKTYTVDMSNVWDCGTFDYTA